MYVYLLLHMHCALLRFHTTVHATSGADDVADNGVALEEEEEDPEELDHDRLRIHAIQLG
jgi:hypothetical protein